MQTSIEALSRLERRFNMAVPAEQIDREVEQRLRKLMRTVRESLRSRCSTSRSICSAGTAMLNLRSSLLNASMLVCIPEKPCSWCEGRDSNPQALRRWNLNPVRLPIPPPSRADDKPAPQRACHSTANPPILSAGEG